MEPRGPRRLEWVGEWLAGEGLVGDDGGHSPRPVPGLILAETPSLSPWATPSPASWLALPSSPCWATCLRSWAHGTRLWVPGLWTSSLSSGMQQLYGAFVPSAPVAMVTQKPFRLVLCTWPASTPSGVGTCHHGNCFPHLNKGLLDRQGAGLDGLGSEGWGRNPPWPGWQ